MGDVATEEFIIPHDVVVTLVRSLSPELQQELDCGPGDYAVTRPNSRTPTRIVDPATAQLMDRFRRATPIVDAVIAFSHATGEDPEQVLVEAFPVLLRLVGDGLLVRAVSGAEQPIEASFEPGDELAGFTVVEVVQVLDDSEVVRALTAAGDHVAVKIARPGMTGLDRLLAREASVLRHLDGQVAPRLVGEGAFGGRRYLAVTWIDGRDVVRAGRALQAQGDTAGTLRLARRLVSAYATIHENGVLHGDVHPKNALVLPDGAVTLIDFGLADGPHLPSTLRPRSRGGIGFFLEPEWARARLDELSPPRLNPLGEQYSVAALTYLVITGSPYLRFSPEKEAMRRQIVGEAPTSFAVLGLEPRPAVEAVLGRSLAKHPSERYPSMAGMASAFAAAVRVDGRRRIRHRDDPLTAAGAALVEGLLTQARFPPTVPLPAPTASVTFGVAGLAYGLVRLARAREDPALLALADQWSERASVMSAGGEAFANAQLEIGPATIGGSTPYHTASGVHWVRACVSQATGDGVGFTEACGAMVAAAPELSANPDLTLGRAGTLLAYATLIELSRTLPFADAGVLRPLGDALASELDAHLAALAPLGQEPALTFLGIAHGWAGISYALLRWQEATGTPHDGRLDGRLAQLAEIAEVTGDGIRWPRTTNSRPGRPRDYLASWCNGSAGFVHLWLTAERVTGDSSYRELALGAARDTSRAVDSGADLCCGVAGRAYAVLAAFRATGDEEWLARARELCRRAVLRPGLMSGPFPLSLYKGALGAAVVTAELASPGTASMPLFEREGWPLRTDG